MTQKTAKHYIIIADDNPDTVKLLSRLARIRLRINTTADFEILEASNGLEALDHVQDIAKRDKDGLARTLLITDESMPVVSGLELINRIRMDNDEAVKNTRILLMSGKALDDKHATPRMSKPVDGEVFQTAVEEFIHDVKNDINFRKSSDEEREYYNQLRLLHEKLDQKNGATFSSSGKHPKDDWVEDSRNMERLKTEQIIRDAIADEEKAKRSLSEASQNSDCALNQETNAAYVELIKAQERRKALTQDEIKLPQKPHPRIKDSSMTSHQNGRG